MRNLISITLVVALPLIAAGGSLVSGRYANRLSKSDIEQIKALVSKEPGVQHNVRQIAAVGPDKVTIQTGGRTGMDSATYYDFNAYKRAGKWSIDSSSIEITTEPLENHRLDSGVSAR